MCSLLRRIDEICFELSKYPAVPLIGMLAGGLFFLLALGYVESRRVVIFSLMLCISSFLMFASLQVQYHLENRYPLLVSDSEGEEEEEEDEEDEEESEKEEEKDTKEEVE
jgi:hypothetical protein